MGFCWGSGTTEEAKIFPQLARGGSSPFLLDTLQLLVRDHPEPVLAAPAAFLFGVNTAVAAPFTDREINLA